MNRLIVVVGFMGCGKTEVAGRLAVQLNLPFIDLDDQITRSEGSSPAQLIRERGEQTFRAIETTVLTDVLENTKSGVVALGGGAWVEKANRELVSHHHAISVWLDTAFEICWKRISTSHEDRPLGATREEADDRYHKRLPLYQLANLHIKTLATDEPDALATRIVAAIANL
jgi:shikimate kinase